VRDLDKPKFVSLTSHGGLLYALDDLGRVWRGDAARWVGGVWGQDWILCWETFEWNQDPRK